MFYLGGEANAQAEFYHQSRLISLSVALEVNTPFGRIDIGVLNLEKDGLIAVVECKRLLNEFCPYQIERYKQLGVPVYGLRGIKNAQRLALTIKRRHGREPGLKFKEIMRRFHLRSELQPDECLNVKYSHW